MNNEYLICGLTALLKMTLGESNAEVTEYGDKLIVSKISQLPNVGQITKKLIALNYVLNSRIIKEKNGFKVEYKKKI